MYARYPVLLSHRGPVTVVDEKYHWSRHASSSRPFPPEYPYSYLPPAPHPSPVSPPPSPSSPSSLWEPFSLKDDVRPRYTAGHKPSWPEQLGVYNSSSKFHDLLSSATLSPNGVSPEESEMQRRMRIAEEVHHEMLKERFRIKERMRLRMKGAESVHFEMLRDRRNWGLGIETGDDGGHDGPWAQNASNWGHLNEREKKWERMPKPLSAFANVSPTRHVSPTVNMEQWRGYEHVYHRDKAEWSRHSRREYLDKDRKGTERWIEVRENVKEQGKMGAVMVRPRKPKK